MLRNGTDVKMVSNFVVKKVDIVSVAIIVPGGKGGRGFFSLLRFF